MTSFANVGVCFAIASTWAIIFAAALGGCAVGLLYDLIAKRRDRKRLDKIAADTAEKYLDCCATRPELPPRPSYKVVKPTFCTDVFAAVEQMKMLLGWRPRDYAKLRMVIEIQPAADKEPFVVDLGPPKMVVKNTDPAHPRLEFVLPDMEAQETLTAYAFGTIDTDDYSLTRRLKPFNGGPQILHAFDRIKGDWSVSVEIVD